MTVICTFLQYHKINFDTNSRNIESHQMLIKSFFYHNNKGAVLSQKQVN